MTPKKKSPAKLMRPNDSSEILLQEQNITITELRAEIVRLKALATCRCGDGFTANDPGTCGNCMAAKTI